MKLPIYQVDAFASRLFAGNPAAVVILDDWLPDRILQAIASENNVSETAFVVPREEEFDLRWFSPTVEVELCGHATLATARVLFDHGLTRESVAVFRYGGGTLTVRSNEGLLEMDFPSLPASSIPDDPRVELGLGRRPHELLQSTNLLAIFEDQAAVEGLNPDFDVLAELESFGVIVSAPGEDCDFVSRFFTPKAGVPEDPVTGSAHCTLIPYWGQRLGKDTLHARQISARGGELFCENRGDRVTIAGHAREYLVGEIHID